MDTAPSMNPPTPVNHASEPEEAEAADWTIDVEPAGCQRPQPAAAESNWEQAPVHVDLNLQADACYIAHAFEGLGSTPVPVACIGVRPEASGAAQADDPALPRRVVLLCDISSSMYHQIDILRATVQHVYDDLAAKDMLGVVLYDSFAEVGLPLVAKADIVGSDMEECIKKIASRGRTNIEEALKTAAELTAAQRFNGPALPTVWLLLSDGEPTKGETDQERLVKIAQEAAQTCGPLVIHSLGFGQGHNVSMMCALASAGSAAPGAYTFLESNPDIPAAVGDILGMFTAAPVATKLSVEGAWHPRESDDDAGEVLFVSWEEDQLALQRGPARVPSLFPGRQEVFVAVCGALAADASPQEGGGEFKLSLQWSQAPAALQHNVQIPPPAKSACVDLKTLGSSEAINSLPLGALVVVAHVLRLRVASALSLCDEIQQKQLWREDAARWNAIFEPLVLLHTGALATLRAVRLRQAQDASGQLTFVEGFLQALERDLGEALTVRARERIGDQRLRGVFLAFAHEHLAMRSASSITACRTTYTSRPQLRARFRFVRGVNGGDSGLSHKAKMPVDFLEKKLRRSTEEDHLSEEEIQSRKEADSLTCFYTMEGWRECLLGIGLHVHERTIRDRQLGLPPEVDLATDYVSAEAYNEGVRSSTGPTPASGGLVSSARGRINGWLPLYLNEANWREARMWAPSALSLLSTQLAGAFNPKSALVVGARILCGAAVSFVHPERKLEEAESPQSVARLSARTLQMCADVHRLFLQMALDHPEMSHEADACLVRFQQSLQGRTRRAVPNLGDLMQYLLLTDALGWKDIAEPFVFEMLRREAGRIGDGLGLREQLRHVGEHSADEMAEVVLKRWQEKAPSHGLVIVFTLRLVQMLRPPGLSLAEVRKRYDRRWGQLPGCDIASLLSECKRIRELPSLTAVVAELLGTDAASPQAVASLVLNADALREEQDYTRAAGGGSGKLASPADSLQELLRQREVHDFIESSVRPPPEHLPPLPARRSRAAKHRSGLAECVARLRGEQGGSDTSRGDAQCRSDVAASGEQDLRHSAEGSEEAAADTSLPSAFVAGPPAQRRPLSRGEALIAWRSAPWDAERSKKSLVLARLPRSVSQEELVSLLRACGIEGNLDVRLQREGGSKRKKARQRSIAFVELVSQQAATEAIRSLKCAPALLERRWVVDAARRGVDELFVPRRFLCGQDRRKKVWQHKKQQKTQKLQKRQKKRQASSTQAAPSKKRRRARPTADS